MGISSKDLAAMQNRLSGKQRTAEPVLQVSSSGSRSAVQIVLGVDPSLRGTGYGVVQTGKSQPQCLGH
jgi:hypothetical protein